MASAKARKEKKLLKDCLTELLERTYTNDKGEQMDGAERISARLFLNACEGDNKAYELIRDTIGQKPVDKIEVAEISQEAYERVAAALELDNESTDQH